MDLLEWVYKKAVKYKSIKINNEEKLFSISVEEEIFSLKTVISFVLNGESLPIYIGKGIGRVASDKIILPEKICIFSNRELNRALLLHKALVASIIYRDKICYSVESEKTNFNLSYARKTLEITAQENKIIHELDVLFPQFLPMHQNLKIQLKNLSFKDKEEKEFSRLINTLKPDDFFRWQKFPNGNLALWVELLEKNESKISNYGLQNVSQDKNSSLVEKEGLSSTESPVEVSLKKKEKEQNPVFHSFEKLETADEYNGGSRVTDADNNISEHSDALKELNLKHVTREGGNAGSIYKANFSELIGLNLGQAPSPRYSKFRLMPEWDYKNKSFKKDFCRLYLLESNATEHLPDLGFKFELEKKYSTEVNKWKHKINRLNSCKKWVDRQLDGEEWDVDAYSKYIADLKSCGLGDNKIFTLRAKARSKFQVCILIDLSLSSDAWIENKRVLDIQLESVGLCGLMLDDVSDLISVYGTWSETRHHCYMLPLKEKNNGWNSFYSIAPNVTSKGYTRLGPSIRQATTLLQESKLKNKLLILITDGKPTDLDHYEGRYGIEDMRHSLVEAQQLGISVQALAIDAAAKAHFPHLFNKDKYKILSDPKQLPEQLFKIFFDFAQSS